jgi:hypothetical protein
LTILVAGGKLEYAVKLAVVNYISNPTEGGSNLILSQFNTLSMGGKLEITTAACPIENLHDKSGKFAALGKPKTDSAASSFGEYSGTYTITASSEEHTSPQPSRHVRRKGAAPFSGAEEQTARAISAHAQCACLLSLQMGSIN